MTTRDRIAGLLIGFCLLSPFPAVSQAPPFPSGNGGFLHGVWLHPGLFGPEESTAAAKMAEVFEAYVRAGIDSVFILVKSTSGHVYFKCRDGVPDPAFRYDFFGLFLQEAGKRGLTVQPWFCVFTESARLGEIGRRPEWLIRSPTGIEAGAVNPAVPEARAYERGLMTDLLKNYPETGWIHLDYIRLPCEPTEPFPGFDERSRALFQAETGADPLALKAKDTGNMMWAEWLRWNGRQVTQFIRELRQDLKALGRPVRISAAVFPAADASRIMIGQDWAEWARTGLVDMICPMLYTNSSALFEAYAREAVALRSDRCRICLGIGIGTSHNQATTDGMAGQIKLSREAGADGVVFFSGSSLGAPFLTRLAADRSQRE